MKHLCSFLLLFISTIAFGQDVNSQFDVLLKTQYKSGEPGAVALVSKHGKLIFRQGYGMANLENNIAMTPEHVFEIGSITKQFTAVSILMLMEQGKLTLEDPITKFIADYPTQGNTITIHHLLTHTSGIKSYTGMERWSKLWRNDMTPLEMIDLFKNEPMDFKPGEKWLYNNSAYFILGYIIEKASDIPYPEFLAKNIFTPLGMKNSYYGSQSKIIKNRAQGYQKKENYVNAEYLSLTQPYSAGSIMSTIDDLLIWQLAIQANKLVKKETIQKAFTNYKLNNGKSFNYGYGWSFSDINGSATIEHSGGIFGYATNEIYLPKEDVYVAVFSNCDCNPPQDISTRMAAIAIEKPFAEAAAKIKLDDAYAKSLTGVYEFDEGTSRSILFDEGQLYSQRAGGTKFKIFPIDKTNFVFESGFTTYQFIVDQTGVKELIYKNRSDQSKGVKTNKAIPERKEVQVSAEMMKQYVGVYEIQPGFSITVTLEDGHLMEQATGQAKFEIFPQSDAVFFLKVVDAQIEFIKDGDGKYSTFMLHQGGQNIKGTRK